MASRAESLPKYYGTDGITTSTSQVINRFIVQRLLTEHPQIFTLQKNRHHQILACNHSGDSLVFDNNHILLDAENRSPISPVYQDGLDALAGQIQEDIAVVNLSQTGLDQLTAIHLCFPNHWAAREKLGRNFTSVHAPVPGMAKINHGISRIMDAILNKGPFVRFAWGLATDRELNHHPEPAPVTDRKVWHGRRFDPAHPELYLRIERQTLHGFPADSAILFTIRTYFTDVLTLRYQPEKLQHLVSAVQSMGPDSLLYKGLQTDYPAILGWVNSLL